MHLSSRGVWLRLSLHSLSSSLTVLSLPKVLSAGHLTLECRNAKVFFQTQGKCCSGRLAVPVVPHVASIPARPSPGTLSSAPTVSYLVLASSGAPHVSEAHSQTVNPSLSVWAQPASCQQWSLAEISSCLQPFFPGPVLQPSLCPYYHSAGLCQE